MRGSYTAVGNAAIFSGLVARFALIPALIAVCALLLGASAVWNTSQLDTSDVYGGKEEQIGIEQARALLLQLVNEERAKRGLHALEPLALANELAQHHAEDMADRRYFSHYNLQGLKCEARWNALGGTDQVAENITYYDVSAPVYLTPKYIRSIHEAWMASELHRKNLLRPWHTHFGCGFSISRTAKGSIATGVEEFVAEYGSYNHLPLEAAPGAKLELRGRVDPAQAELAYVTLGHEDLPFARDPAYQMAHIEVYRPPEPEVYLVPKAGTDYANTAWAVRRELEYDPASGAFSVKIPLPAGAKPGAYYISAWVIANDDPDWAFRAMTQVVLVKP
jgi:uncharacterized protein YkwD